MNFSRFLNYEEIKGCGVIPHYNCKKKKKFRYFSIDTLSPIWKLLETNVEELLLICSSNWWIEKYIRLKMKLKNLSTMGTNLGLKTINTGKTKVVGTGVWTIFRLLRVADRAFVGKINWFHIHTQIGVGWSMKWVLNVIEDVWCVEDWVMCSRKRACSLSKSLSRFLRNASMYPPSSLPLSSNSCCPRGGFALRACLGRATAAPWFRPLALAWRLPPTSLVPIPAPTAGTAALTGAIAGPTGAIAAPTGHQLRRQQTRILWCAVLIDFAIDGECCYLSIYSFLWLLFLWLLRTWRTRRAISNSFTVRLPKSFRTPEI